MTQAQRNDCQTNAYQLNDCPKVGTQQDTKGSDHLRHDSPMTAHYPVSDDRTSCQCEQELQGSFQEGMDRTLGNDNGMDHTENCYGVLGLAEEKHELLVVVLIGELGIHKDREEGQNEIVEGTDNQMVLKERLKEEDMVMMGMKVVGTDIIGKHCKGGN